MVAVGLGALIGSGAVAGTAEPRTTTQAAPAAQVAQSAAARPFDIPAQPLAQALIEFGQQAGLQVTFDPAMAEGLRSRPVSGRHAPEDALRRMLEGLPIMHSFADARTVALSRVGEQSGALALGRITVEAGVQTATGPVDGYVAERSASVTKTDTPIIETPRAVSVVTADAISDRKALHVEEALRYTAGVQVDGYGNDLRFDQIKVRGFDVTSSADFRDGLRQTNTGWLSYFRTEAYGLERIEVVKGPNSVLYGQVSPGGMVNRVTKRPAATAQHEVEVQLGTDEHYQGQFDLGGPVAAGAGVQYRVVGLARDAETGLTGVNDDSLYFAPAVTWTPTERLTLTVLGHAQDYETAGSTRPFQFPSGDLSHFWAGDEDFDHLKQTQYVGGYEGEYRLTDVFTLRQNLRYASIDTENQYLLGTLQDDGHTIDRTAYGVYEDMRNLSVDTSVQAKVSTGPVRHTAVAGIDYAKIDADVEYLYGSAPSIDMANPDHDQDIARPSTVLSRQDIDAHQTGFYAQDQIAWGGWRFSAGLRHDRAVQERTNLVAGTASEQTDTATTGSAGLLYLFDSGLAPYASYATSFIPQFGANAAGTTYDPTEGEQVEVGLKYQPPGSRSLYTVSVFNLVEKNALTRDPADPTNQIQTGEQRSRGIELEAAVNLWRNLDLVASYTYLDAEITKSNDGDEGNRPATIPEHMASAWGNYRFTEGSVAGLALGLGARYIGENYGDNANTQTNDDAVTFDARVSYSLGDVAPGASIGVNVTNLADEEHVTCEAGYCYRGRGRTVIGSLTYRW